MNMPRHSVKTSGRGGSPKHAVQSSKLGAILLTGSKALRVPGCFVSCPDSPHAQPTPGSYHCTGFLIQFKSTKAPQAFSQCQVSQNSFRKQRLKVKIFAKVAGWYFVWVCSKCLVTYKASSEPCPTWSSQPEWQTEQEWSNFLKDERNWGTRGWNSDSGPASQRPHTLLRYFCFFFFNRKHHRHPFALMHTEAFIYVCVYIYR